MKWDGLWIETHRDVYEPSDDTFLLARAVREAVSPTTRFLEVGCGTGLVSLVAARAGADVIATDANPLATRLARRNARANDLSIEAVTADLAAGVESPIDVVAFNPPYLPTGPDDHVEGPLDLAFDGGPSGNDVVLRFAQGLKRIAPPTVLVVHSSLSDPAPLQVAMDGIGYDHDVVVEEKHFYERLWVRQFRRR